MKLPPEIANLCLPAKVYLGLSVISLVFYLVSMVNVNKTVVEADPKNENIHHYTMGGLLMKIFFTVLWVLLLNYICKFKYGKKIAWFIVLLPFFFLIIMLIGVTCAVSFIALQTDRMKGLQKQLNVQKNLAMRNQRQQQQQQQQPQQQQQQQQPDMFQNNMF